MKQTTKELIQMTIVLVALFLILTHFTGFAKDVGAATKGWGGLIRDFQGRGQY